MYKFLHDVDFFEGLVDFERIYMDAFECEGFVFGVFDEVDATEAALADDVDWFILVHTLRWSSFCDFIKIVSCVNLNWYLWKPSGYNIEIADQLITHLVKSLKIQYFGTIIEW